MIDELKDLAEHLNESVAKAGRAIMKASEDEIQWFIRDVQGNIMAAYYNIGNKLAGVKDEEIAKVINLEKGE